MSSNKEKIVSLLVEDALQEIISNEDMEINDDEEERVLDDLSENLMIVLSHRRGVSTIVPKSINWRDNVLTSLSDDRFRQMMRIERNLFWKLTELIKEDEVFNNAHSSKQFPIEVQLATTLFRLGSSGESASIRKIATMFGIGDGGTILKITNRVFCAILKMRSKYIMWPSADERTQLVADTFSELPFCIGYIDGTEIKLSDAPIVEHTNYFSRNHVYALKLQVVCDYKLRIRHAVVGHPGSWHDSRIYKNSTIFKNKETYFNSQQWIAGDSAYPLSETLITPYRSNSNQLDRNSRIKFNLKHSSYRVRVEHCFGQLKEKFCSLKELRMRIASKENYEFCCNWVIVCCILHNFLKENEDPSHIETELEQEGAMDNGDTDENIPNHRGEIKRQAIYSLMFD